MKEPIRRILIATTVPETISSILRGQPRWLSSYFVVSLLCSPGPVNDEIHLVEGISPTNVTMYRKISPFRDIISILSAYIAIRRMRPDLVHSYTPKAGLVVMIASFLVGVPVRIHTFTGLIFPSRRGLTRFILEFADKIICATATHVVAEGRGVAEDLREAKITSKQIEILANGNVAGVDIDYFSSCNPEVKLRAATLREQLGVNEHTPVLGYVGRITKEKGIEELVSALHLLNSERTANGCSPAILLCVGDFDANTPLPRYLDALLKENPNALLVGWQNDIRPYLSLMDVLVLPSYREGFPNVLLQGGAMGVPLIATDVNGSNEIISDSTTGILVKPMDTHSLYSAIRSFLCSPKSQQTQLGLRGQHRVRTLYSQAIVRNALIAFYTSLLKE